MHHSPPNQTADIHYVNAPAVQKLAQVISGQYQPGHDEVAIQSNDRGLDGYQIYPIQKFEVKVGDLNDCKIRHSGNTGNVVLNDPAYGDVKTCTPDEPACRPHPSVKPLALCRQDCLNYRVAHPYENAPSYTARKNRGVSDWDICTQDCNAKSGILHVDRQGHPY